MKPQVSILIPAFNAQEWIADTLRSAVEQTWDRKEIIVVDDGSSDQTLAVARQFESDCVHVVGQKNAGAAAARNRAFSMCTGDYIQWLDADDLLAPDKISRQMEVFDQCRGKHTLLSSAFGRFMYRSNHAEFIRSELWCDLSPVEWLLRKMGQNAFMQTGTWLVSRELTEAAGPWDTTLLADDDGEYFCRVLLASEGVRFVPEARVYYRDRVFGDHALSYVGESNTKRDAHWRSMQLHIGYLRQLEDSPRVHAACVTYLQTLLCLFYPERPDIFDQMEELAGALGGKLEIPDLSWRYAWIRAAFGYDLAKRAQVSLRKIKWLTKKSVDKTLFRIEGRSLGRSLEY